MHTWIKKDHLIECDLPLLLEVSIELADLQCHPCLQLHPRKQLQRLGDGEAAQRSARGYVACLLSL